MSRVIALDTETTGLDPAVENVFEIACVDVSDPTHIATWTIEPHPVVVDAMHPAAAEVNRYHERTSAPDWRWDADHPSKWDGIGRVLDEMHEWLHGAHIAGAVPDFDTRFLTELFRTFDRQPPRWHYHLIDVETLAVGWLLSERDHYADLLTPPWKSDDLAAACGIEPPSDGERHTALGDALWVARWYRALTGGA